MQTPWGKADSVIKIQPGVSWVSTPSHGGLMVAFGAAQKHLTPKAIEFGERYSGAYLCYEEDCAYAIAFYENPAWYRFIESQMVPWSRDTESGNRHFENSKKTDDAIRADMRAIAEYWFPEFFGLPARHAISVA